MIPPQLSPQQRERADQIFKSAWKRAFMGVCASALFLCLIISKTFGLAPPLGSWIGPVAVLLPIFARGYATQQVREAGLSVDRVETRFIPKTTVHFQGAPVIYRWQFGIIAGRIGVVFYGLLALCLAVLYFKGRLHVPPVAATTGFLFLAMLCLCSAYFASAPVSLRLDENGVCTTLGKFGPRRMAWSTIAGLEVRRTLDYAATPRGWDLTFQSADHTPPLKVSLTGIEAFAWPDKANRAGAETLVYQLEVCLGGNPSAI